MKIKTLVIILLFVNIFSFVSASFNVSKNVSHSIETSYSPGSNIRGWINISLSNELANSTITDSFGNSISLIELIELNELMGYITCTPESCESHYSATNTGKETKIIELETGEPAIFGFKFEGDIVQVESVNFTLDSTAPAWCYNQLKIDYLNDEMIDDGNTKSSNELCEQHLKFGCFNNSENFQGFQEISLDTIPFCQKIELTESPGFKIGAWVKNKTGYKKITMELYDKDGNSIENGKSCQLNTSLITSNWGMASCNIDYLVRESDYYYVCIYADERVGDYKVKGYATAEGCGFHDNPSSNHETPAAYGIFAQGKKFDAVGSLKVDDTLPDGESLGYDKVHWYITDLYGDDMVCPQSGCIVPVKIIAESDQVITLKELFVKYLTNIGRTESKKFYDLTESPASITIGFQQLYLDQANFSVPSTYGNASFNLKLNGKEIFSKSETIFIEKVPSIESLTPTTIAAAYPTDFKVTAKAVSGVNATISQYEWDFGDSATETTIINTVEHTYSSTGQFELTVKVTDSNGLSSSKTFSINVESPEQAVNITLNKKLEDVKNVKKKIESYPMFYQNSLNSMLNISDKENILKGLVADNEAALTDDDFIAIMNELLALEIPNSIVETKKADMISFSPNKENINIDILKMIGEGEYDEADKEKYVDAVFFWNQGNMDTKLSFKQISAKFDDRLEPIITGFELKATKKEELKNLMYSPYLILKEMEGLQFEKDYSETSDSGYVYISLKDPESKITFITTEDIEFSELPLFISPEINRLEIVEGVNLVESEEEGFRWGVFILFMFLLIFIGLAAYIFMQEWYKRKYETYLFKDRNNLYNIVSYIENSKKSGIDDKEIDSKLKKSGWNSEQRAYAMNKYLGKRTGMLEIPIDKIMNLFSKKPLNIRLKNQPVTSPPVRNFPMQTGNTLPSLGPRPGYQEENKKFK